MTVFHITGDVNLINSVNAATRTPLVKVGGCFCLFISNGRKNVTDSQSDSEQVHKFFFSIPFSEEI